MTFLHGITVQEIDSGSRPIQTVRSAVIGLVGTAPGASAGEKSTLTFGTAPDKSAVTLTSVDDGVTANEISFEIAAPAGAGQSLSITVTDKAISVTPATDGNSDITTTAKALVTAINADTNAKALILAANDDVGTGVVKALSATKLSGGSEEPFPLNKPTILAGSATKAKLLGTTGTLPGAINDIFNQAGALIIVVRVDDQNTTRVANVVAGIKLLTTSQTETGYTPRILIAPEFSHETTVATELETTANKLRGMAYIDSEAGSTSDDAMARADSFGERVELTWPNVKVFDVNQNATVTRAYSALSAGLRARIDNTKGFWWSKSNQQVYGVEAISQPVEWILGSTTCLANLLNENSVSTLIRDSGFKHWGNRTCSSDPRWIYEQTRRTADIINDSILENHMWAVDRNITKSYFEAVTDGVNAYLRELKSLGAIINGNCWYDPDLNTTATIQKGIVYFDFDFVPPYPAEHIVFRSRINNDYLEEVFV
jgi:hypothetical protein